MRKHFLMLLLISMICSACTLQQGPAKKTDDPAKNGNGEKVTQTEVQNLAGQVTQYAGTFDGKVGLYAKNLKTINAISINADEIFPTASTHKLVVALAVYKYLYADAPVEKRKIYDQHIKNMMVVSDNQGFFVLLREIEATKPQALTQVLTDLGLTKTRIHSKEAFQQYGYHSVTTPYEMAVVFETIYNEQYLGKEMSVILKEELAKTIFKDEIPRLMQNNRVMHKVGQLPGGILNDVGIVDDGKDVILISAYTVTKRTPLYASEFIANLSAKSYNALRTR